MKRQLNYRLALIAAAAHFASLAYGANAPSKRVVAQPQPDSQFLEYLGSLEGDDENWTDVAKSDLVTVVSISSDTVGKPSSPVKKTAQNSEAASREVESK